MTVRVHFSYHPLDKPWGGGNNFMRALHGRVTQTPDIALAPDIHGDYDILFMNQLNRGRGLNESGGYYAVEEIRAVLNADPRKKLVVRAVNLKRNSHYRNPVQYFFDGRSTDKGTIALLNMAHMVVFQSAWQKSFFDRFGYRGNNYIIVHNGTVPLFLDVPGGPKPLGPDDDLILTSSAMARRLTKKQDIIAALSLIPKVRIVHAGIWPPGLAPARVEMAGVLPHEALAKIYATSHYFLHPAIQDPCPNSLIEGMCAGLPSLYNPGPGSGGELSRDYGLPIDVKNLAQTVAVARARYNSLAAALADNRSYYSIDRAAGDYMDVFRTVAGT